MCVCVCVLVCVCAHAQTVTTPEKGDALRACVASILCTNDIREVPNFIEDPRGYLPALQVRHLRKQPAPA
eukprot:4635352-Pyramimonas_sp.AAC.2